ncbi:hypothetical protein SEA_ZION_75 [Corynebacterium phage Zion]|uniref:Ribonucleoside-diphosphate reductase n=3 Tax=Corynebacterium virus Zion TaxID=2560397 RepID=A0A2H4P8U2_9CAUD|nr:ribonucleotide reductase large subunit [Corynebacterium phage Zion]ATW58652.1 hypothetical protein SEA_POTATOCHIP_75 [Corynebacterium phage PotatoChip]ATW58826.1 hypothetical protein SEA_ZION_75 [Corynebacterium phage Zion]AYR03316.1 ribonucleotide reductase [Corynebacterium phage PeteyPab]
MEEYRNLNAELNLYDESGKIQFDKDKEAARAYFLQHVNQNTVFFHSLEEKTNFLVENRLWDQEVVNRYPFEDFKALFKQAYAHKFRFQTFVGALKFYRGYALKTFDGKRYYERFEDRVVMTALAHSNDYEHAKRLVDHIIEGRFQPATPTFLNAGRADAGGPTSCYLLRVEDNLESINRAQSDAAQLSKRGGGVALSITNVREAGAPIKGYEGKSSGVIPFMKVLEDTFSWIDQLGQRQGAGAIYINAHHPDIMKVLDTKRENADEKIRIKTLSLGVVIPDITFELARNNDDMYLFSPYDVEKEYGVPMSDISITEEYERMVDNPNIRKTKINARKLFQTIAEIQFESGYPYIVFEDTVNYYNPAPNVGRISMSNLCVAPETRVLTDEGYVEVSAKAGQYVNAWNGEEFSRSYVDQTGEDQELITVNLSNGASLDVTPYHDFYVKTGYGNCKVEKVKAAELQVGDKLEKFDLSVIDAPAPDLPNAYTAGLFTSEGTYTKTGTPVIRLYGEKKDLMDHISYRSTSGKEDSSGRISAILPSDLLPKFAVPTDYNLKSRLEWLAGVIDGDGYGNGAVGIQIASINKEYLEELRVMLTTLGVFSKWSKHKDAGETDFGDGYGPYPTKEIYRLVVSGSEAQKLRKLGLPTKRVIIEPYEHQRAATEYVKVESVVASGRVDDTYCLNEPSLHKVVFEGIRTGNCSEILQPQTASEFNAAGEFTSPGRDVACNLGSLNVAKMAQADRETFVSTVHDAHNFLTNVAVYGDFSCSPSIDTGNGQAHSIGLGQMNLHGYFIEQGVPYDSEQAIDMWRDYIAAVTFEVIRASCDLAKETGITFDGFEGSNWQSGETIDTMIHALDEEVSTSKDSLLDPMHTMRDWVELRDEVSMYGLFNQNLQAIPPTGSISYVNNATSSIHPIASKIEIRKEGSLGRVYYPAYGLTNENFHEVKTAYEMGYKPIVDMYAASTPFIDQGQSLTLFYKDGSTTRDLNKAQIYAHKAGVKTIYYIRVQQPALEGTEIESCVSCML